MATFFKDITFSVLYEQMRAQDQFKKLFTDTLQSKLWQPIESMVRSCEELRKSEKLRQFERESDEENTLSSTLSQAIIQSKSSLFRLLDIRDWLDFFDGTLSVRNFRFDVVETLQTIKDIVNYRADLGKVRIEFQAIFTVHD